MKPRISLITLAVDDLERALAFYRDGLGLKTDGIIGPEYEYGAVAFFELEGGLKLALWPRTSLERDSGVDTRRRNGADFTLAHNVATQEEVDALIRQAEQAGAQIVKRPQEAFWGGYAAYFRDPDGHLWEVAWNPQFLPNG